MSRTVAFIVGGSALFVALILAVIPVDAGIYSCGSAIFPNRSPALPGFDDTPAYLSTFCAPSLNGLSVVAIALVVIGIVFFIIGATRQRVSPKA